MDFPSTGGISFPLVSLGPASFYAHVRNLEAGFILV